MGSGQSTFSGTPLGCMLDNWKAFRRQADYGIVLCKDNLVKFCTLEWTTFGVECIVTRDEHWDQYLYIDIWQDLVANPPPWLQKSVIPSAPDPISSEREPSPISLSSPVSEHTRSKTGPGPVIVRPGPTPKGKVWRMTSNYNPGDTQFTLTNSSGEDDSILQMPLREIVGPSGGLTMIYIPFTTSDLYNWKQQNPPFSEDPAPLTAVFETLITAHNPTWGDMRVAFNTLLTAEERRLVLSRAREWLTETGKNSDEVAVLLPESAPDWPHNKNSQAQHSQYATAIVQGMKRIRETPNWAKLYNIRQEKNENPAAFYERLCNTCKRYTDLDPEDANGKRVLIPLFIGQSYEDIRKKLQKLEGALGKNIEELLEIAIKVYDRRDDEERKKGARVLAMALREGHEERGDKVKGWPGPPGKGKGPRLGRNQCATCREEGHWKNECSRRQAMGKEHKDRTPPRPILYNSTGLSGEGSSP
uniref:Core shell protein Gag P30 domain-containing protein n=1 Tax=Chelonoidis abingdonii TaxID=106734 RepID=A0A8C0IPQ6_CHEAB